MNNDLHLFGFRQPNQHTSNDAIAADLATLKVGNPNRESIAQNCVIDDMSIKDADQTKQRQMTWLK